MSFSVATWNINSVRLRLVQVKRFLTRFAPDVLCLQEIKCPNELFPRAAFAKLGYEHIALHGQKGYHGVAVISRHPFEDETRNFFCGKNDARHVSVTFERRAKLEKPLTIHNFYVPAGGDIPDPVLNVKFEHKLQFLDELATCSVTRDAKRGNRSILVGDLNVAPLEHDVWSHKQLLKVVSHTPIEVEKFEHARAAGGWIDVMRSFVPDDQKLYTWWSYRAPDWKSADKGRRLDHIWASPALEGAAENMKVFKPSRGWVQPSDHVPVIANFAL
jgi:exodeoxyribonuclease-3